MRTLSWNSLFIQSVVWDSAVFVLFDTKTREILHTHIVEIKNREYDTFLENLILCLSVRNISPKELDYIVYTIGPAPFTGGRIGTLTVNTFAFVHKTPLIGISYFDYLALSGVSFPYVLEANKQEVLVKMSADAEMQMIPKEQLPGGKYAWFLRTELASEKFLIQWDERIDIFLKKLSLENPVLRLETLYLKKPNITFSSKHHGSIRSENI